VLVLNPGTASSYTDLCDISVEFEKAYETWNTDQGLTSLRAESADPSKTAVIMYSVPEGVLDVVVTEAEKTAAWLFLTSDNQADGYLNFSPLFANFVASLDKSASSKA
jgi:hypothetical protein